MPQGVRTPLTRPQQQDSSARAHCGFASRRSCSACKQKRPASFFHLRGKNSLHSAAAPLRCMPLHYATRSGFQNVQRALLFCALALARCVRLSGFAKAGRRLPAARCMALSTPGGACPAPQRPPSAPFRSAPFRFAALCATALHSARSLLRLQQSAQLPWRPARSLLAACLPLRQSSSAHCSFCALALARSPACRG